MNSIQKEREAFEKLPDINAILHNSEFGFNEGINQYYHPNHTEHRLSYAFLMGAWSAWQAAKAQAVPGKDAVIKKLSDQLYAQEMKASAARVLCETACELLDDYAHQDAMVILNDLEQAMSTGANQ